MTETTKTEVLIVGAGLTGLTIAYLLRDRGLDITIIESRDRIGGRILTKSTNGDLLEMGATWLGPQHTQLNRLLSELSIDIWEQHIGKSAIYEAISTSPPYLAILPANPNPSYRISGGSHALIDALFHGMGGVRIHLNQKVSQITKRQSQMEVTTDQQTYVASYVISTLPPHLLISTVRLDSSLPDAVAEVASQTHTWMGESIKIAIAYARPFWRDAGVSGTIMSNVGPISEMYDHSDVADDHYALMGFFNGAYYSLSKSERLEMVMSQLRKYYGTVAEDYLSYEEYVWKQDPNTFVGYDHHVMPHQNNGHPFYQRSYIDQRLIIAGTETSAQYPGYMEGAIRSADHAVNLLESAIKLNS